MRRAVILAALLSVAASVPHALLAGVVINEILFDPAGTDTGLEKVELYNPDAAADMGGWELYPDGIGYFTFPSGFSLGAQSFAVVHLRTSGTNDAQNLYHSAATGNMGNSSGSIAIFRPGGRGKDTIADFVRYHRPGAAERKTWESAAQEAGLWTAGEFVDITGWSEGSSLGLAADGVRANAASWKVYAASTIGSANAPLALVATTTPPAPTPPAPPAPPPSGGSPTPSLGADAGPDITVIAGTIVLFRGLAFGLDGEVLPTARFLWNFGDGTLREGKSLTHVYHFPGAYRAHLSVQSGELAGADWRTVNVLAPALRLSEIKPGPDGFIELLSASEGVLDLGGISVSDDGRRTFRVPPGTLVGANGVIVFANAATGLNPQSSLTLADARGAILDAATFSGLPPAGGSWERFGEGFVARALPTPGTLSQPSPPLSAPMPPAPPAPPVSAGAAPPPASGPAPAVRATAYAPREAPPSSPGRSLAAVAMANAPLAAGLGLGALAAAAFIIMKRRLM